MMGALIAGGMAAAWSESRDQMANLHADGHYHPNKSGLYEVPMAEYGEVNFPLRYQGNLIKVMAWGLDGLAVNPHGYRVVLMQRDPEEIRQSFEAFFDQPLRAPWIGQYTERIERAVRLLRNRNDVLSVDVIQYRELVANPLAELAMLDWPIDVRAAAETIDVDQCRFKRELLTVGI